MIDPLKEVRKSKNWKWYSLQSKIKLRWEILMYKLFNIDKYKD